MTGFRLCYRSCLGARMTQISLLPPRGAYCRPTGAVVREFYANCRPSAMLPNCVDDALRLRKLEARQRNAFGERLFVLESSWHCHGAYVVDATSIPALICKHVST